MFSEVSFAVLHTKLILSQCNPTGTEPGNGGQFIREFVVKKIRLIFEIKAQ